MALPFVRVNADNTRRLKFPFERNYTQLTRQNPRVFFVWSADFLEKTIQSRVKCGKAFPELVLINCLKATEEAVKDLVAICDLYGMKYQVYSSDGIKGVCSMRGLKRLDKFKGRIFILRSKVIEFGGEDELERMIARAESRKLKYEVA